MQKNRAFMLPNLHNYPILVRSTGIEDVRRYEKSLDFHGFFPLNANVDAKIFEKIKAPALIVTQKQAKYGADYILLCY